MGKSKVQRDGTVTTDLLAKPKKNRSIPWILVNRAKKYPNKPCIERQTSLGTWTPLTAKEYLADVNAVARGLIGEGLQPGDAVVIFGSTSYEWSLLDLAALSAGLVVVPIYETDGPEQVRWILENSHVRFAVTDTEAQRSLIESQRTPELGRVLSLEAGGLAEIYELSEGIEEAEVDRRRDALTTDDLATVIYTSGTTGRPKGVELTHGNFVDTTMNTVPYMGALIHDAGVRILLFLPLAHVMARSVFFYALYNKAIVGHVPNVKNLLADLESFKPTALLVVPRVLEKIYNAAEAKAGKGLKLRIFRWAAQVAVDRSAKGTGPIMAVKRRLAKKLVWNKILDIIGHQVDYAVSAGAPLGKRMGHFFRGIGLTVVEGYGLTECTGAATACPLDAIRMGTVGLPLPGWQTKLADGGEILIKGPGIFKGYQNDPEATEEVFEGEWFRSGDLGAMDKDGYLTITGRKKEVIVTAGGKNVSPAALEDPLRTHPLISEVVVIGDQRPFISALLTLDKDMLPAWLASHDLPPMDVATAARHPKVLERLEVAVAKTNKRVSRAESIRKFSVLTTDFTVANGLLTPSMKVKRKRVQERFAREIENLYRDTRKK